MSDAPSKILLVEPDSDIMEMLVAALSFSLLFFQLDAVLHAMGLSLPLLVVAKIVALSRLAGRIVPLSIVGWGSKDAAVIGLLAQQGIAPAVGFTATILILLCSFLLTSVLSLICWWINPLVVRRAVPSES